MALFSSLRPSRRPARKPAQSVRPQLEILESRTLLTTPGWNPTASMTAARYGQTASLLPSGEVLVAGGYNGSSYLASAELYNPSTGTWTATGSMATARNLATATLLNNGEILVAGGFAGGSNSLASAELYNPSTGDWSPTGSLLTPVDGQTATLLNNGEVLVAGGYDGTNYVAGAELYNPSTGAWTATGSMTTARYDPTATLLKSGEVLVAGGVDNSSNLASAELYNPSTGTWTPTGSMSHARAHQTTTLLPNNEVLVAGGYDGSNALATAELYNPSTGTWTLTGNLTSARYYATATLLANGQVLEAGGSGNSGDLASAELYNPSTGTWAVTGSLSTARDSQTATLLTNGQVLVAGGFDGLASAELYVGVPATITPVTPNPSSAPVNSVTITFPDAVTGFVLSDLTLTQGSSTTNLLSGSQATLTTADNGVTWILGKLNISPQGGVAGYTLTLNAAGSDITDAAGNILVASASKSFTLVDPALTLSGTTLTVPGTSGNDTFTFKAGPSEQATINGVTYAIDPTVVSKVLFAGNGGSDTATLDAAGAYSTATLALGSGTLSGSANGKPYAVNVGGVTSLTVNAGSAVDYAAFTDTSGGSVYTGAPTLSEMKKGAMVTEALSFATVAATGSAGDTAYLLQGAGQYLVASHDYSLLRGYGKTIPANEVLAFPTVIAYASGSSTDAAYLYSTSGSNHFLATPTSATLITGGVVNVANGFQDAVAISSAGDNDSATFADTAGSNTYVGTPNYSYLINGKSKALQEAVGFAFVYAVSGGGDLADVMDPTGKGGYHFAAMPNYSLLSDGTSILNELIGFSSVTANVTAGGTDYATLYDAPGVATVFNGGPTNAYVQAGAYYANAIGFALVSGLATMGNQDTGYLSDGPAGGLFAGQGPSAVLEGLPGYNLALLDYSTVIAYGSTGSNKLELAALDYAFSDVGTWMPV